MSRPSALGNWARFRSQFVVWADDGQLDDVEMKKVKAAEQLENMDKKTLKHKMEEKGLDSSGIRKRTLVKRICLSQNPEHDPVKLAEEWGVATTRPEDKEAVMGEEELKVEMAEYFKKTVSELANWLSGRAHTVG